MIASCGAAASAANARGVDQRKNRGFGGGVCTAGQGGDHTGQFATIQRGERGAQGGIGFGQAEGFQQQAGAIEGLGTRELGSERRDGGGCGADQQGLARAVFFGRGALGKLAEQRGLIGGERTHCEQRGREERQDTPCGAACV